MNKTLFIVCPFSNLESFLNNRFNTQSYFYTAIAANVEHLPENQIVAITNLTSNESIDKIYIVNDIDCPFIDQVISNQNKDKGSAIKAQKTIEKLYRHEITNNNENLPLQKQKIKLAQLNVQHQIKSLEQNHIIKQRLETGSIEIKGLITTKSLSNIETAYIS